MSIIATPKLFDQEVEIILILLKISKCINIQDLFLRTKNDVDSLIQESIFEEVNFPYLCRKFVIPHTEFLGFNDFYRFAAQYLSDQGKIYGECSYSCLYIVIKDLSRISLPFMLNYNIKLKQKNNIKYEILASCQTGAIRMINSRKKCKVVVLYPNASSSLSYDVLQTNIKFN